MLSAAFLNQKLWDNLIIAECAIYLKPVGVSCRCHCSVDSFTKYSDLKHLFNPITVKMVRKKVSIVNEAGLHARPAAALVKLAGKFESDFFIHMYGYRVNGKSILGVMTLAAEKGAELELELDGPDEEEAAEAISALFANGFKEQ